MNNDDNSPYRQRQRQQQQRQRPNNFLGTAVTTALAVYGTYHLAIWAWNTWNTTSGDDEERNNAYDKTTTHHYQNQAHLPHQKKKRNHNMSADRSQKSRCMTKCRSQTASTLAAFSTMLIKKIDEGTETTMIRHQLKEIRKLHSDDTKHQESILWMSIQVETTTRLITMVYAYTLLFTTLTIQVHRMGGQIHDTINSSSSSNNNNINSRKEDCHDDRTCNGTSELDDHRSLIQSYDAFWEQDGGLDDLLTCVREAVQSALKDWNIHDPNFALHMMVSHLQHAISQIRRSVEGAGDLLQRFIIQGDDKDSDSDSSKNSTLLNEMYDILESPVANDALRDALQCTFTILHEQYIQPIFSDVDSNGVTMNVVRPLPHVISQVKAITSSFLTPRTENNNNNNHGDFGNNPYVHAMEQLPSIQEAATISFCS